MNPRDLDERIEEIAKTVFSYCRSRTSNVFDAEDLAQEILLELYRSVPNLRNNEAFYGFMLRIAGNCYKQWLRKRSRRLECSLTEEMAVMEELFSEDDSVYLLRREMTLLAKKYREAAILYYLEDCSCARIAQKLSISESMVKYLLFKARQILKEGMTMERNYGEQSYRPKEMDILFWGGGDDRYHGLREDLIAQNILFACYNDRLTEEQISLEIGVALPYMEKTLQKLCELHLLIRNGRSYSANLPIFTAELTTEIAQKLSGLREETADLVMETLSAKEETIRNIGFVGADMDRNTFNWQMSSILLYQAMILKLQNRVQLQYPDENADIPFFLWGVEKTEHGMWSSPFAFGISDRSNEAGDRIQFMDFPINGEMVHFYFYPQQSAVNVFLDIARNKKLLGVNDRLLAAEMVKKGYIRCADGALKINVPVFTESKFAELTSLFAPTAELLAEKAETMTKKVAEILKNHLPAHLQKMTKDLAYLYLFEDDIAAPMQILYERDILKPYHGNGLHPTTYVILK